MLYNCFTERTKSRTADTIKPQLSQSPPVVFIYSVTLKFSDLSFMDIAWSKGKSRFTQRGSGDSRRACRGQVQACLALLWICPSAWLEQHSEEQVVSLSDNVEHDFPCCLNYFWNANLQGLIQVLVFRKKPKLSLPHRLGLCSHGLLLWVSLSQDN